MSPASVWQSFRANIDFPTHRDGVLWEDWIALVYSEMSDRNLPTSNGARS